MNQNCNHSPVSPPYLMKFGIEVSDTTFSFLICPCHKFGGVCYSFWYIYSVGSRSLTDDEFVIDVLGWLWCLANPRQNNSRHKLRDY